MLVRIMSNFGIIKKNIMNIVGNFSDIVPSLTSKNYCHVGIHVVLGS